MKGRREAWLIDSPSIARLSWSRGRQDLVHIVDLRGLALHHEKILAATDPIANQLRKVLLVRRYMYLLNFELKS